MPDRKHASERAAVAFIADRAGRLIADCCHHMAGKYGMPEADYLGAATDYVMDKLEDVSPALFDAYARGLAVNDPALAHRLNITD